MDRTNGNGQHKAEARTLLGTVTAADSEKGVTVHITRGQPVELLRQGQFVVIDGQHVRFFGTISGFRLAATDPAVAQDPPDSDSRLVFDTLSRSTTYAEATVRPSLELTQVGDVPPSEAGGEGLKPARTIPGHFARVFTAGARDFQTVFGSEEHGKHFAVGRPRDMDNVQVCLDLGRLVERSNGIFGRSGTGKSFLARLILCGLVKTGACVNLVFDMHTEYAYSKEKETGGFVKGLRELFGMGRVRVYSLDEQATRRARGRVDGLIRIPIEYIEVNDLMTLQQELDLSEAAPYTASVLRGALGPGWLAHLIEISPRDLKELCENTGVHQGSVEALKRRVETFKDLDFITRDGKGLGTGIDELLADLKAGHNVILEFGRYNSVLAYMLVANIITKRIHKEWVAATERYDDTQNAADKPRPLMVTIEEAHKFLSQKSTIFSIIAREMRKYSVTLLIIDQRPSSIDTEVLSQLGTRITALLSDERDIDAVFTGTRASHMRQTLATLDTRQEVLIFGHAVPMEVVLRTREFDEAFYRSLGKDAALSKQERAAKAGADLFGEG